MATIPPVTDQSLIAQVLQTPGFNLNGVENAVSHGQLCRIGKEFIALNVYQMLRDKFGADEDRVIQHKRRVILSPPTLAEWATTHALYPTDPREDPSPAHQEILRARIFQAFVAASIDQHGAQAVSAAVCALANTWLHHNMDYLYDTLLEFDPEDAPSNSADGVLGDTNLGHVPRAFPGADTDSDTEIDNHLHVDDEETRQTKEKRETAPPIHFGALAMLNEKAMQRGRKIPQFNETESGVKHAPAWTVELIFEGKVFGKAIAGNKKRAREMAAQIAWRAIDWEEYPLIKTDDSMQG